MNCTLDTDAQCEALEVCYNHTTSNPLKPCTLNNLEIRGRLSAETFRGWTSNIMAVVLMENEITDVEDGTFQELPNLVGINLVTNLLTEIRPGMFTGLENLRQLGLCHNRITLIRSNAFSGLRLLAMSASFNMVYPSNDESHTSTFDSVSNKQLPMVLEEYAFANMSNSNEFVLNLLGNIVSEIPAHTFQNTVANLLMLNNMGIEKIDDDAFNGLSFERLELRGNNIQEMGVEAFRGSYPDLSNGLKCRDYENWEVTLQRGTAEEVTVNCTSLFVDFDSYLPLGSMITLGSCGMNMLDACCYRDVYSNYTDFTWEGGYIKGTTLLMDDQSTVMCMFNSSGSTLCGCGVSTRRYDTRQSSCVFCNSGERWVAANDSSVIASYLSPPGHCEACEPGTFSLAITGEWIESCEACPPGYFSGTEGSSQCFQCEENQYSRNAGSSSCTDCPTGRYTAGNRAAQTCRACDAMYLGSPDCTVPVLGISIGIISLLVIFIVTYLVRRKFEKDRKARDKLRRELLRQRALVKVKTTDISLLGSAWKLKEDQVQLKKLVGQGVHGKVYQGAFNNKWEVAVKIMATNRGNAGSHLSLSGGSHSSSSKRKSTSLSNERRRVSSKSINNRAKGHLFDNDEVKFLMRTRHERIVMFLGVGRKFGGNTNEIFLVTEWMNGGNLSEFLWDQRMVAWKQRIQILIDCLEGLSYLHLLHKSVHCDLKSPNILLEKASSDDGLVRAKLGDFGLSRIFTHGKQRVRGKGTEKSCIEAVSAASWKAMSKGYIGTPRWMAPELMGTTDVTISPSCDVYSFGIVMWETWCQQKPWRSFVDSSDVFEAVQKGIRPMTPSNLSVPEGYQDLMRLCWSQVPTDRPLVDVVLNTLRSVQSKYARDLLDHQKLKEDISSKLDDDETSHKNHSIPDHNPWTIEMTASGSKMSDLDVLAATSPVPQNSPPQSPSVIVMK